MKHLLSMLAIVTASVFAENEVRLVETFKGVDHNRPTDLVIQPDGSNRLFLIQQLGQIDILPEDRNAGPGQRFLDLDDQFAGPVTSTQFQGDIRFSRCAVCPVSLNEAFLL